MVVQDAERTQSVRPFTKRNLDKKQTQNAKQMQNVQKVPLSHPPFSSEDHSGSRTVTGLLIMVWYATTGEDRGAGEADETADAASSSPGEFSRVLLAIVTREPLFFLLSHTDTNARSFDSV